MKSSRLIVAVVAGVVSSSTTFAQSPEEIATRYRDVVTRITSSALLKNESGRYLHELCDGIGHRLAGSPQLDAAIAWAETRFHDAGLKNVRRVPCKVPAWVRGAARLEMIAPRTDVLPLLALGGSVGTPPDGLEAEVVVVKSFAELDQLGDEKIKGKIVVYDVPYEGYGKTVQFRALGASRAAKLGAVAALNRSAGFGGNRTPHTGALRYEENAPRIPAAAVAAEDAGMLGRLYRAGEKIRLRLTLGCRTDPDVPSADVIGDLVGSEKPDEIVLVGGHLDSWDVGQGAQDDGGGSCSCLAALETLVRLGLHPRRTIRLCFWTNEENGLRGAEALFEAEKDRVNRYVACYENDGGIEKPSGFGLSIGGRGRHEGASRNGTASRAESRAATRPEEIVARARATAVVSLLAPLGCGTLAEEGGGADIGPFATAGISTWSISTSGGRYFEWHHTAGDTVDKIDSSDLDLHVAAQAALFFILADLPERL